MPHAGGKLYELTLDRGLVWFARIGQDPPIRGGTRIDAVALPCALADLWKVVS